MYDMEQLTSLKIKHGYILQALVKMANVQDMSMEWT